MPMGLPHLPMCRLPSPSLPSAEPRPEAAPPKHKAGRRPPRPTSAAQAQQPAQPTATALLEQLAAIRPHKPDITKAPEMEPPGPDAQPVDCTVFAPDRVERQCSGLLQVFIHAPQDRERAAADATRFDDEAQERGHRSLVLDAPIGSRFGFEAEIDGFVLKEPREELLWTGRPEAATFQFMVPRASKWGQHIGTVRVSQNGFPVGRIVFQIEVVREAKEARHHPTGDDARRYRTCFCSYSSLDRTEMLKRAQGLQASGLETFIDVMDLRPGDIWDPKIFQAIDRSDLFVLIWSHNAEQSKWVRKEARYALKRANEYHGPDFHPIPVEGPPIAPVPKSLRAYHFNDKLLSMIRAAELEAQQRERSDAEEKCPAG